MDAEAEALAGARAIVTPHAAIAALFGSRAVHLPWALPAVDRIGGGSGLSAGSGAVVFPAPALGRAGAYEVRDVARRLGVRLVVCGDDLEGADFWDGVAVERRDDFDGALADAACVVLPAYVEHQPRRLLRAAAMGVPVIASDACGLGALPNVTTVSAGDVAALSDAVGRACDLAHGTPVLSSRS